MKISVLSPEGECFEVKANEESTILSKSEYEQLQIKYIQMKICFIVISFIQQMYFLNIKY